MAHLSWDMPTPQSQQRLCHPVEQAIKRHLAHLVENGRWVHHKKQRFLTMNRSIVALQTHAFVTQTPHLQAKSGHSIRLTLGTTNAPSPFPYRGCMYTFAVRRRSEGSHKATARCTRSVEHVSEECLDAPTSRGSAHSHHFLKAGADTLHRTGTPSDRECNIEIPLNTFWVRRLCLHLHRLAPHSDRRTRVQHTQRRDTHTSIATPQACTVYTSIPRRKPTLVCTCLRSALAHD